MPFLTWLGTLIVNSLLGKLWNWLAQYIFKREVGKKIEDIGQKDEEALRKALESGDKDAIAKAGENLLNSIEHKP